MNSLKFDLLVPRITGAVGADAWSADDILARWIPEGPRAVMRAFVRAEPSVEGPMRVYALEVPDGMGIDIPVGELGELGIGAKDECLYLALPRMVGAAASFLLRKHVHWVEDFSQADGTKMKRLLLALPPDGSPVTLKLGSYGSISVRRAA